GAAAAILGRDGARPRDPSPACERAAPVVVIEDGGPAGAGTVRGRPRCPPSRRSQRHARWGARGGAGQAGASLGDPVAAPSGAGAARGTRRGEAARGSRRGRASRGRWMRRAGSGRLAGAAGPRRPEGAVSGDTVPKHQRNANPPKSTTDQVKAWSVVVEDSVTPAAGPSGAEASGAPGAGVGVEVVARGDAHDLDVLAGAGGVDHLPVAHVQADVAEVVEEHQVARLQVGLVHPLGGGVLRVGRAGDVDARRRPRLHGQAGAVVGVRALGAVLVRLAELGVGEVERRAGRAAGRAVVGAPDGARAGPAARAGRRPAAEPPQQRLLLGDLPVELLLLLRQLLRLAPHLLVGRLGLRLLAAEPLGGGEELGELGAPLVRQVGEHRGLVEDGLRVVAADEAGHAVGVAVLVGVGRHLRDLAALLLEGRLLLLARLDRRLVLLLGDLELLAELVVLLDLVVHL